MNAGQGDSRMQEHGLIRVVVPASTLNGLQEHCGALRRYATSQN